MTNVKFDNNGSSWVIGVSGHAGYGPKGTDIVCAGCSLLSTMIAQIIAENEDIVVNENILLDGEAYFDINTLNTSYVDSQLSAIERGFELLANTYPENVFLTSNIR